jgi:vitamin B12 transporter
MSRLDRLVPLAPLLVSLSTAAQNAAPASPAPPPVSAEIVVTAEAQPEPQKTLGAAATVIGRAEMERSKATSVAETLRAVPGLDVVQSGGAGTVTSLFLRGTNSTQTLVLVDGVALNSPAFGLVDLSAVSTANLERVEVVRGPFSALWGSEAIGGVVQLFTRRDAPGTAVEGRATGAFGNASAAQGTADVAVHEGAFTVTGGWRRVTEEGALPNESFAATNLSGAVEASLGGGSRLGVVLRRDTSVTGIPFSAGVPTPQRKTTSDMTTLAVPATVTLGAKTTVEASLLFARGRPTYSDPDDPYGFTFSESDERRSGGRLVATHDFGAQRLSVGSDVAWTSVTSSDSYGVPLDEAATRTWSVFLEDRIALAGDRLVVTAGLRRDDNSAYGTHWSPRGTLVFVASSVVKVRVAGGGAFRSPTTGELYYPFSGNPDLRPEESRGFEAGADVSLSPALTWETTAFRNDVTDLIQYDPQTFTNENVGKARLQGIETGIRGDLGRGFFARVSYTYLDATDEETGLPLLRRPKNRASATVGKSFAGGASFQATAIWVGSRLDRDAVDFNQVVTMPSYFRFDVAGTAPRFFWGIAPFARVANVLGSSYAEANGFPAPGRRFLAGLDVAF